MWPNKIKKYTKNRLNMSTTYDKYRCISHYWILNSKKFYYLHTSLTRHSLLEIVGIFQNIFMAYQYHQMWAFQIHTLKMFGLTVRNI